jgi:D-arabinose 1-dehydrogenase-like Zn-dependent alcohol dehydrogenase
VRPRVRCFELADANRALQELKFGHLRGAFVLRMLAPSAVARGQE